MGYMCRSHIQVLWASLENQSLIQALNAATHYYEFI